MTFEAMFTRLRRQITAEAYPALATAYQQSWEQKLTPEIARLLGCGWTLGTVDTLLGDWLGSLGSRRPDSRHQAAVAGLFSLAKVAHLGQAGVVAWLPAFGGDLTELGRDANVERLLYWAAVVPAEAGPACEAAGLTLDEAADLHAAGTLNVQSLMTVAALTRPT